MAHNRIGTGNAPKKEPRKLAEDTAMKPLVKEYAKENPDCYGKEYPVLAGRLTTNGWFLLETREFVYMLPGKNTEAQYLFATIFPALHDKEKKQLLVVPDKKDKFGAYLATDSEKRTTYFWDAEDYRLFVGQKPTEKKSGTQLSLKDFE